VGPNRTRRKNAGTDLMVTTITPVSLWCGVCGDTDATVTTVPLNGLPVGVVACASCREAVQRREVGVVVRSDGRWFVVDGR
jgi:hypothetical protein